MSENAPIACTLDAADLKIRTEEIADLNARWLLAARREELTLKLDYAAEALCEVKELVAAERSCCAFLSFEIVEQTDRIRLTIKAPEGARYNVGALFEAFLAKSGPELGANSCGCARQSSAEGEGSASLLA